MLNDIKVSTPKSKDETHWQADWWHFQPLIDHPKKPIAWTNSSIIFTAHPTEPWVTARLFSSSKQFICPSPDPVFANSSQYEPPSIISASPDDEWLFAYFPGRGGNGQGCLWKRGSHLDSWAVKDYWSFARGGGVVTAAWAGAQREWVTNETGSTTRLPPRGPMTPVSSPTLLLVTEDHLINMCYIHAFMPSLKVMRCSLAHPSIISDTQQSPMQDPLNGPGGVKVCISAAIGLGYNESSILVAMRSQLYPTPDQEPQFDTMDLNLSLDMPQPPLPQSQTEWEAWGEESTIELCEVQLGFDGHSSSMNISTNPLPSIQLSPGLQLTGLEFICTPPTPNTDIKASSKNFKDQKRANGAHDLDRGQIYLLSSFLDFNDYTTLPRSELFIHSMTRNTSTSALSKASWVSHCQSTRTFSQEVLAFFIPYPISSASHDIKLLVGLLDSSGTALTRSTKQKIQETPIGSIIVLSIVDLSDDSEWEKSTILAPMDIFSRELPLNTVLSPNNALLSSVSSHLLGKRTIIHTIPKRHREGDNPISLLSSALISAIRSRKSTSDITHALSLPSIPVNDLVGCLYGAFRAKSGEAMTGSWTREVLGIAIEIYGNKAQQASEEAEKANFIARRHIAHNLCSIASCNAAFEGCREGDAYDLEAVWQLIGISQWAITFTEELAKDCLIVGSTPAGETAMDIDGDGEDLFGSTPTSPTFEPGPSVLSMPSLLYLAHPYALQNLKELLTHVNTFRQVLNKKPAGGENSQMAKDVLIDLVNCSGLKLDALITSMSECIEESQVLSVDDAYKSLASCQPVSAMKSPLKKAVQKLSNASHIDKPRLFIKSADLVDGLSRMSIADRPRKAKDEDVVSKSLLTRRGAISECIRCGGRTTLGGNSNPVDLNHVPLRWGVWERIWTIQCICGGSWSH